MRTAIRFFEARHILVRDLEKRGFSVEFVRCYSNGPGRSADICLRNGVVVNFDRHSSLIWAEGPPQLAMKVETFLRRRYKFGGLIRSLYVFFTTVFFGLPQRVLRFFAERQPLKIHPRKPRTAVETDSLDMLNLSRDLLLRTRTSKIG